MNAVVGQIKFVHRDQKRMRDISEFDGGQADFSIQMISVDEDAPGPVELGHHAHRKVEIFTCLEGEAMCYMREVNAQGEPATGELIRQQIVKGTVVQMKPFVAHVFVAEPGCVLHVASNTRYDETDVIPYYFNL